MYAPTAAIGGLIYVGGASDFQGRPGDRYHKLFSFDPVGNTIGSIAAIPGPQGEPGG
jgi:hypothetical protein